MDNTKLDKLGYLLSEPRYKTKGTISPVEPTDDLYTTPISSGGYFGYYLEQGAENLNEFHLIRTYRQMALLPEVDSAIDDIINESINSDIKQPPVLIDLQNLKASDKVKKRIREEFDYALRLLDFDDKAHQIFRRWYVDGRLFFHKIIDVDKPDEGIKELRYIDPLKIKKVRVKRPKKDKTDKLSMLDFGKIDEFYIYKPNGFLNKYLATNTSTKSVPITKDAITFVPSGATDYNNNMVVSYLHKAIKASNQLQMLEDSIVIYRLSRSPERRIFYIDVGNLPTPKAEQYMKQIMNRYRTKIQYDATTGYIRDGKKHMSMLEDFFIPRKDGSKGTEIDTLAAGQNLGELADLEYFQKKLYEALNVPPSRLQQDSTFNIGKGSEIARDELKFAKFVARLRKQFSHLFLDILKSQLILKKVVSSKDWDEYKEHIQFDYLFDNHYNELKNLEILTERLTAVSALDAYVGKYFSHRYVLKNILKLTDREVDEIQEQIKDEEEKQLFLSKDEKMALEQQAMEAEMGAAGEAPPEGEEGQPAMPPGGGDINDKFRAAFGEK